MGKDVEIFRCIADMLLSLSVCFFIVSVIWGAIAIGNKTCQTGVIVIEGNQKDADCKWDSDKIWGVSIIGAAAVICVIGGIGVCFLVACMLVLYLIGYVTNVIALIICFFVKMGDGYTFAEVAHKVFGVYTYNGLGETAEIIFQCFAVILPTIAALIILYLIFKSGDE